MTPENRVISKNHSIVVGWTGNTGPMDDIERIFPIVHYISTHFVLQAESACRKDTCHVSISAMSAVILWRADNFSNQGPGMADMP